jgi:SAM-dependent methyltransferase
MASSETPPQKAEGTFRNYSAKQSAAYAEARRGYHPNLLQRIVDHHVATGGKLGTVIDVGCGPGFVVRAMAPQFDRAVAFDPSPAMIETARGLGGASRSGDAIQFELSTAEQLGLTEDSTSSNTVPDGTADLITAAAAAHWFDMPRFWPRAAQLLRPGGTVALWIVQPKNAHPSVPNAAALNAAWKELNDRELRPFMAPGNLLAEDLYKNLLLPWTIPEPTPAFDQADFVRTEWGTPGGEPSDAEGNELLNGTRGYTMEMFELGMATASPVTRWREANPDKAGTEADVVRIMRRTAERLLHEAGVPEGEEVIRSNVLGALLLVKKKM